MRAAQPVDVAQALRDLSLDDQVRLFRLLPREQAGAVLHEMDDPLRTALVAALDPAELSGILDEMPVDNAAAVINELPAEQVDRVLDLMPEAKAEEVQGLLQRADGPRSGHEAEQCLCDS